MNHQEMEKLDASRPEKHRPTNFLVLTIPVRVGLQRENCRTRQPGNHIARNRQDAVHYHNRHQGDDHLSIHFAQAISQIQEQWLEHLQKCAHHADKYPPRDCHPEFTCLIIHPVFRSHARVQRAWNDKIVDRQLPAGVPQYPHPPGNRLSQR